MPSCPQSRRHAVRSDSKYSFTTSISCLFCIEILYLRRLICDINRRQEMLPLEYILVIYDTRNGFQRGL